MGFRLTTTTSLTSAHEAVAARTTHAVVIDAPITLLLPACPELAALATRDVSGSWTVPFWVAMLLGLPLVVARREQLADWNVAWVLHLVDPQFLSGVLARVLADGDINLQSIYSWSSLLAVLRAARNANVSLAISRGQAVPSEFYLKASALLTVDIKLDAGSILVIIFLHTQQVQRFPVPTRESATG